MNPALPRPASWIVEFVALAAIWGASFLFMRIGTVAFGPVATAGLRVGIAALFLLPILVARGHAATLREHWKPVFLVGITNSAIPFFCFSFALQSITVGLSSMLNATVPLFGAAIAWAWLKDRPSGSRMVGLVVGFVGVGMLAWDKASFLPNASGLSSGWGVLACLFACFCYGISASFTKRYLSGLPSLVSATGSQLGAALALLPLSYWFWPEKAAPLNAWGAVFALGVMCTGLAYILFFRLIERAGPAKALSVTFAIPVFAIVYGVLLLGEAVTPWMLVCGVVIVLGTTLSTGMWHLPNWRRGLSS